MLVPQNACENCTNATNVDINATNETEPVDPTVYARVSFELYFPHISCAGGEGSEIARPDPLNVSLPVDANTTSYTLQEVMEAATDQDESYQFSVLFPGEETGYLLEGINGTEEENDCKWLLYYQAPDEAVPTLRLTFDNQVSFFEVEPNATVVLCYQNTAPVIEPFSTSQTIMSSTTSSTSSAVPSSEAPTESPTDTNPTTSTEPMPDPTTAMPLPTMGPGTGGTGSDLIASTQLHLLISVFAFLCLYLHK